MELSRKVVPVLLVVTVLSAAMASPAAAAPAQQAPVATPTLACADGTCQLVGQSAGLLGLLRGGVNLALTQLPFETKAGRGVQAKLDATRDITLSLPVGEVSLANASLQVEVGEDGHIRRLTGAADMPFPTFGLLDDVSVVTPARANVGLDLGKNLPDVGLALDPDRSYLIFSADSASTKALQVTGRAAGRANDLSLSFAPGQRLTLVIDTVEPVAYLDGKVTLSGIEQVALLGGILETTPVAEYVPDTLPLRERNQFGLSGKFSKNLAESRLAVKGAYLLDGGILPAKLGIEAQLVSLLGELTLSRDGVFLNGALRSAVEPDRFFEGGGRVVIFIPFSEEAGPGHASVDASVKVPAARLGFGAGAEARAGRYELRGQLRTPLSPSELRGRVSGRLPDVAGAVGSAAGAVSSAVGDAAGAVGTTASQAAGFITGRMFE